MKPTKFIKRRVVIEAIQYSDESRDVIIRWIGSKCLYDQENLLIFTEEGKMMARRGDWIIKGVKGEFYPCKPDIFELTYEALPHTG